MNPGGPVGMGRAPKQRNEEEVRKEASVLALKYGAPEMSKLFELPGNSYEGVFSAVLGKGLKELGLEKLVDFILELNDTNWAYYTACTVAVGDSNQWNRLNSLAYPQK